MSLSRSPNRLARSARTVWLVSVLGLSIGALGCAGWPPPLDGPLSHGIAWRSVQASDLGEPMRWAPRGPGAVFATAEEAALDALAHCYLTSRAARAPSRRSRGGTIHPVAGGFSYDTPEVVADWPRARLRYRMRSTDVAHFRHYPLLVSGPSSRRVLRREAVEMVSRRDRAHRPLFVLRPDRVLEVTKGALAEQQVLARLAAPTRRSADALDLRLVRDVLPADAEPLALQPISEAAP